MMRKIVFGFLISNFVLFACFSAKPKVLVCVDIISDEITNAVKKMFEREFENQFDIKYAFKKKVNDKNDEYVYIECNDTFNGGPVINFNELSSNGYQSFVYVIFSSEARIETSDVKKFFKINNLTDDVKRILLVLILGAKQCFLDITYDMFDSVKIYDNSIFQMLMMRRNEIIYWNKDQETPRDINQDYDYPKIISNLKEALTSKAILNPLKSGLQKLKNSLIALKTKLATLNKKLAALKDKLGPWDPNKKTVEINHRDLSTEVFNNILSTLDLNKLETLKLVGCTGLNSLNWTALMPKFNKLKELDLSGDNSKNSDLDDTSLYAILDNFPATLKTVKLAKCGKLTSTPLTAILNKFATELTGLRSLNLSETAVTFENIEAQPGLTLNLGRCALLSRESFEFQKFNGLNNNVDFSNCTNLSTINLKNIGNLNISGCSDLTNVTLDNIGKLNYKDKDKVFDFSNFKNLINLTLSIVNPNTDVKFDFSGNEKLENFSIKISDDAWKNVVSINLRGCNNLKEFNALDCKLLNAPSTLEILVNKSITCDPSMFSACVKVKP